VLGCALLLAATMMPKSGTLLPVAQGLRSGIPYAFGVGVLLLALYGLLRKIGPRPRD
jgi:hypothetical protein